MCGPLSLQSAVLTLGHYRLGHHRLYHRPQPVHLYDLLSACHEPQLLCALLPADLPPLEARVNICAEIELEELHLRRARHLLQYRQDTQI